MAATRRYGLRSCIVLACLTAALGACAGATWARPAGVTAVTATTKAPAVTKNPAAVTVEEGQPASFTATASGTPTPAVQWQLSTDAGATWAPIAGATSTTLTIAATSTSENGYEFRAVFTSSAGEATSKAALLTVRRKPLVTQQPQAATVEEGSNAVFEAAAAGVPAPTVQWELSGNGGGTWTAISGATSPVLTIAQTKASMNGNEYRAVFKNVAGTATTETALLTVQKAPAVTRQPVSSTIESGQSVTFEAAASGLPAPSVQWQLSTDGGSTWAPVEGATTDALTLVEAQLAQNGYEYRAVFTNAAGTATTNAATLTVRDRVIVTEEPRSTIVQAGEEAIFHAAAKGFPPPSVAWEVSTNSGGSWSPVPEATTGQLVVTDAQLSQSGIEYRAVFTNPEGSVASNAAVLTVASNDYSALAWGENLDRQLGVGSTIASSSVPMPVSGLRFVTAVSAGGHHGLALRADGSVVAWGDDENGQLGDGETAVAASVPVPVSGLSGVKAIAAGGLHSLALLNDGTVMAWGDNENGQLGNGTTKESDVPVAVKGLTGVRAVAAGGNFSLALLNSGAVMAWGGNGNGQLGNGTTKESDVPVAVKGLTGVSQVSAGEAFALALLSNGTVESWGENAHGQLGDSAVEELSTVPVAVADLTGVTAVAAGEDHALALLGGGSVMAWGAGGYGQLGNGTTAPRAEAPVVVSGLSGVNAIAAGGYDSAALLSSGSIMTWGADVWGTLGNGTSGAGSDVPVTVSAVRKAAAVSVGGGTMLAYGEPTPAVTSVSPDVGAEAGGATVTISGADLSGATSVRFGTASAGNVTVLSSTSLTATAPPGTGTVHVTVTTPSGESTATLADRYTYLPPPKVLKLSPKSTATAGGATIQITGSALTNASAVSFGNVAASSFRQVSGTALSAVAPPGTVGPVYVTVTTPGGTSATGAASLFKYTPTVEAVTPDTGPVAGGTQVTVTGTAFSTAVKATSFKFGTALAKSVTCSSSTTCTMLAPAHAEGTVNVVAVVNKVTSPIAAGGRFTYG